MSNRFSFKCLVGKLDGLGRRLTDVNLWWRAALPLLLLLLAIGLRLIWHRIWLQLPLAASPAIDEALHWEWIQSLAAGAGSPELPYFRAPLFAWGFGLLHRLGIGLDGLRLTGTLLGIANLVLLALLARRHLLRGSASLILLLAGCSGAWIYFGPQLLMVHLFIFWLLTFAGTWLKALENRHPAWWLLSGLLLGLACITRPHALLLVPVLAISALMPRPASGGTRRLAAALPGLLLPILSVALINGWPASGVLISSQGGVNFWIGNHPGADGVSAILPEAGNAWERTDATALAEQELGYRPGPGEESSFYYKRSVRWMLAEPGEAAKLLLRKAELLLAPLETGNNSNPGALASGHGWMTALLALSWWLVLLPGLAGLALGFPRKRSVRWVVLALIGTQVAVLLLFFVNARFRLPLVALLALPAAELLAYGLPRIRATVSRHLLGRAVPDPEPSLLRMTPRRLLALGLLLLLPALAWRHLEAQLPRNFEQQQRGWQAFQLGNAWIRLERPVEAHAALLEALALDSTQAEVRLTLGLMTQDSRKADSLFRAELLHFPGSAKAWNNLGTLSLNDGHLPDAIRRFQRALELRPGLVEAHWNLGLALARSSLRALEAERPELARMLFEQVELTPYRGRGYDELRELLP